MANRVPDLTFEKKHGYSPLEIAVAIDALAVFVNKDNPIRGVTLPQVDTILSSTRKCGYSGDVTQWGPLRPTKVAEKYLAEIG